MKNESAVQFETDSRIHMGLAVKNLEQSVAFYTHAVRPGADEDPAPLRQVRGRRAARQPGAERSRRERPARTTRSPTSASR